MVVNQTVEWINKRISKVRKIRGYNTGETIRSISAGLNLNYEDMLKLNSNENFFISRDILADFIKDVADETDIRIYPQNVKDLLKKLSDYTNLPSERIVLGNGADQLIDSVIRIFLEKGKKIISVNPTFSMYQVLASIHGHNYVEFPLKEDFSLDVDLVLSSITSAMSLFFLCSPNSPTAIQFHVEDILKILNEFQGIVVLDETYAEFGSYTLLSKVEEINNLIILRSFSKSFGLAGLRLGYAVSNPEIVDCIKRIQPPYSVNTIVVGLALKLLDRYEIVEDAINRLKAERTRLIKRLNSIQRVQAFNSDTNFVLFKTERNSTQILKELMNQGILVKNMGKVLNFNNCLRVTVGLPEMNNRLIAELKRIC